MSKPLLAANLGFGSLGGVDTIVWDRTRQKNGDYLMVAFIDKGQIEYKARVSEEQKAAIEAHANEKPA